MKISTTGLNLIKSYEGCRLTAYKAVSTEKYYTIGYGHYGADVKKSMKITQAQADAYLVADLEKFEDKVNKYQAKYNFNQNQFDALVSFAYNVGSIDQLTANGTRTIAQISAKIPEYCKSGGKVLSGLVKRRAAEKRLFNTAVANSKPVVAQPTIKNGSKGAQAKYLQLDLNYCINAGLAIDGNFGTKSVDALKKWQKANGLTADGAYGPKSYEIMKKLLA